MKCAVGMSVSKYSFEDTLGRFRKNHKYTPFDILSVPHDHKRGLVTQPKTYAAQSLRCMPGIHEEGKNDKSIGFSSSELGINSIMAHAMDTAIRKAFGALLATGNPPLLPDSEVPLIQGWFSTGGPPASDPATDWVISKLRLD